MTKEDEKIYPNNIADLFCDVFDVKYRKQQLYVYKDGAYSPVTDEWLFNQMSYITRELGRESLRMVKDAAELVKYRHYLEGGHQPFWLCNPNEMASALLMSNGILDFSPMLAEDPIAPQLLAFNPGLFATARCDYPFQLGIRCSEFDSFLDWFTCGDGQLKQLVLEMMAYCLLPNLCFQKLFFLVGDGGNGKSVLLKVIQRLVGKENCSALNVERFGGRFDLASLDDKLVNITADMNSELTKVCEGTLKMLCDTSPITMERKGKDSFSSVNRARIICATNSMPRLQDRTDGIWRRLVIIPALAKVDPSQKIADIEQQFNYSGILNSVLEAAAQLIARGDFKLPEISLGMIEQERREANPAADFLSSYTQYDSKEFVVTDELHRRYQHWCEMCGYKPLAVAKFGTEIRRHYNTLIKSGRITPGKSKVASSGSPLLEGQARPRRNGYYGIAYHAETVEAAENRSEIERQSIEKFRSQQISEAEERISEAALEKEQLKLAQNRLDRRRERERKADDERKILKRQAWLDKSGKKIDEKRAEAEEDIEVMLREIDVEEDIDVVASITDRILPKSGGCE